MSYDPGSSLNLVHSQPTPYHIHTHISEIKSNKNRQNHLHQLISQKIRTPPPNPNPRRSKKEKKKKRKKETSPTSPSTGSRISQINLSRPTQIITIPVPPRTRRLLNIVNISSRTTTALSPTATARTTAGNGWSVSDVRLVATAPRTRQAAYTPQPEEQECACDRADDNACYSSAGYSTRAAGAV